MAFWKMIKEGNDHFEATRLEPKVEVCNRHYVFDAQQPPNSSKPIVFNPTARCPAFVVAPEIAGPALEKEHADELQYAQLVKANVWVAPIRTGLDGGMNRVFLAQVGGSIPPARVPAPGTLPPQPGPVVTVDNGGTQPTLASKIFGGFFGSKQTEVAATETTTLERGSEPAATGTATTPKAKPHAEPAAVAEAKPKATEPHNAEPRKSEPQQTAAAKLMPAPQQQANAAAPPAGNSGTMNGAQPVVPAGNFDSRWGGLQ
jgi:hypothetical protein